MIQENVSCGGSDEFKRGKREVLHKLKRLSDESGADGIQWDCKTPHWYFFFCYGDRKIYYDFQTAVRKPYEFYFPSEEAVRDAVEKVGEKEIKKYLFGITEVQNE